MNGKLILEDGSCFTGEIFGCEGIISGEIVLNTSMVGYQEIITDPSYEGQIVLLTYPVVGNYGINDSDFETIKPCIKGLILREKCEYYNNYQAKESLKEYLNKHKIIGISGIDTRALTRLICAKGSMKGIITNNDFPKEEIARFIEKTDNKKECSQDSNSITSEISHIPGKGAKVVCLDYGLKNSILQGLKEQDFDLYIMPRTTKVSEIMKLDPAGVFLSNGPGNPKDMNESIETIKSLINEIPILGVGLGHQLLCLSLGADTYRLKASHRGANHPVKDLIHDRVYITNQIHGYAVNIEDLPGDLIVTHINLNDNTIEGIKHKSLPIFSVQYHPNINQGYEDCAYVYTEFKKVING
ncbi:carbamoyl-phosphate synthase small subunit [Desulfonispora thiosulfatigenes DSM 11270]|uniref:Carbamoyl phosphate synthase small chain n=1 Tax=Desulfonispora thiosulfatigenes DSM 11270 TaxID=656914 RepID=A0A1W1UR83_DESTI|nr:glutamine-hydrolyzing carbamoyl-phosphate synthase small subunit [Desulfonispora thiosulfatigenes]SMB83580.1 carbamoyl-phosphate synthase small subunit [Desulfonispora thiosulfatigenes DSM 11270]